MVFGKSSPPIRIFHLQIVLVTVFHGSYNEIVMLFHFQDDVSMRLHAIILIVIATLCVAAGIYTMHDFLAYGNNVISGRADAAIVLGAASYGDKPSPVFRERINHAVRLYRGGYVKKIIFTGARDSIDEPAASAVASLYAAGQGVPRKDILGEDRSATTEENLFFAREVAMRSGLKTFLVVSDPLHMKRSMMLAEDLGMAASPAPTPTTRYLSMGNRVRFLAREIYFYDTYLIRRLPERIAGRFLHERRFFDRKSQGSCKRKCT